MITNAEHQQIIEKHKYTRFSQHIEYENIPEGLKVENFPWKYAPLMKADFEYVTLKECPGGIQVMMREDDLAVLWNAIILNCWDIPLNNTQQNRNLWGEGGKIVGI